jgi:hypothetical protein
MWPFSKTAKEPEKEISPFALYEEGEDVLYLGIPAKIINLYNEYLGDGFWQWTCKIAYVDKVGVVHTAILYPHSFNISISKCV